MRVLNNILCADFETATDQTEYFKKHNDTCVLLWNVQNLRDDSVNAFGSTIDSFIQWLKDYNKSSIIYFHNLTWDGNFIFKWLLKNGFQCFNEIPNMKQGFSIFRSGGQIFEIKLQIYNKYNRLIRLRFKCSLKLLSEGIESLGECYGIKKHLETDSADFYDLEPQEDYNKYPKRFVDYCYNDVRTMKLALRDLDSNIKHIESEFNEAYKYKKKINIFNCLTIGACAYRLCLYSAEKYGVQKYQFTEPERKFEIKKGLSVTKETYDFGTKLFYGGYVDFNHEYQNKEVYCPNGIAVDINSAHPNSMTGLLPYGEKLTEPPVNCEYRTYYHIKVKSARCRNDSFWPLRNWNRVNKKEDPNDLFDKYRYVPELNNFECWYLKEEWEFLCEEYEMKGVKILETYYFKADYYYRDIINYEYEYKSFYKKAGKPALAQTFKILLNSSFGKHATREKFATELFFHSREDFDIFKDSKEIWVQKKTKRVGYKVLGVNEDYENMLFMTIEPITPSKYYNKVVAATITAETRLKLWKCIRSVGYENWLYSDTDSCYFKDGNTDSLDIDSWRLGAWDIENKRDENGNPIPFKYFQVKRSKSYFILDENHKIIKSKFAGVNRQWLKKNGTILMTSNWNDTIENCNLKKVDTPSGLVLQWKDLTLKESK